MHRPLRLVPLLAGVLLAGIGTANAQTGKASDVELKGDVLEPRKLDASEERAKSLLKVPDGFRVSVFAAGLGNPRMLAVGEDGTVYATRRSTGDVVMLEDENGDGRADGIETVASRAGMHGITITGTRVHLVTLKDVYIADIEPDGTFSDLQRIINDLPDAGQHPNRTLAVGPDGGLYISAGSTCNACQRETSPESATMLRATPDGKSRTIFARGLRNTIGFGFHPQTGELWGMDHGIDWYGEGSIEELNKIERGKQYGWPYVYGMGELNPQDDPPEGITLEQWRDMSAAPVLGYTAHSAPMQMAFYRGGQFPAEYDGDALVAMRGSWNRRPPSGYEVVRIRFDRGRAVAIEPFVTGFLQKDGEGWGYLGRPTGLAIAKDGALLIGDDSNGVIYRIAYEGKAPAGTAAARDRRADMTGAIPPTPPPSELAMKLVAARDTALLTVTSPKIEADRPIPLTYSAYGDDASPPIAWGGAPAGTQSFVVILDDPDASPAKPFNHWTVYDIPATTTGLREGLPTDPILQAPKGVKQGLTTRGSTGYTGMKPPVGDPPHRYHFQVFALDGRLDLPPGADRQAVLDAMKGKVLAAGVLVGTFERR